MSTHEPLLSLDGVKKYFYENDGLLTRLQPGKQRTAVRAVDGVDLDLTAGTTLGIVGESGCGKSTLAKTVLQLLEPTDGSIQYQDADLTEQSDRERRAFRSEAQMIFQDPFSSLNPRYTVKETLVEPMKVHGIGDSKDDRLDRAQDLLDRVGLGAEYIDRYPHEFSGGQRQRIAIARALAVEPNLIVADEPVSALDVSVQAQILNLLRDLREEMDLTMLFISHDLSVVRQICDEVAVMYLGQIVERAQTKELFENPAHPYTEVLVSSIPTPDPTDTREKITLTGDVPTPVNPPNGCRFHTRCPKVIPDADWAYSQEVWRRVLRLKKEVGDGEVQPSVMREQLSKENADVSADDIVSAIFEEHVVEGGLTSSDRVTVPEPVKSTIFEALSLLVDGSERAAYDLLDQEFSSVCESTVPEQHSVSNDHHSVCHLLGDEYSSAPQSNLDQQRHDR
ncbi:ATP-binding cassette domain-containing protein [Halobellus sp. Atlit-38R]|uniref:ABC transporter ATP-binding protein n=1 Tax=Halobellus sp. Atlit-38R TaxID=2282131 RepID=UPI000EF2019B|nr:oligopeptide/dipeptide ABC transporter ATP-binding protein [Halobellus sp. Atlit-38R]RLM88545.1 ATP-binding cassette domain-containing protein [Halobellus sp. Atlit-38R]